MSFRRRAHRPTPRITSRVRQYINELCIVHSIYLITWAVLRKKTIIYELIFFICSFQALYKPCAAYALTRASRSCNIARIKTRVHQYYVNSSGITCIFSIYSSVLTPCNGWYRVLQARWTKLNCMTTTIHDTITSFISNYSNLINELLSESHDSVGMLLERLPRLRRVEFVVRRSEHEQLQVLEEPDEILDEFLRLPRSGVHQTTDSLLE